MATNCFRFRPPAAARPPNSAAMSAEIATMSSAELGTPNKAAILCDKRELLPLSSIKAYNAHTLPEPKNPAANAAQPERLLKKPIRKATNAKLHQGSTSCTPNPTTAIASITKINFMAYLLKVWVN